MQRGHLKPIYSPPATLPEVLAKRIGYPLSDAQILQILDNLPRVPQPLAVRHSALCGLRPRPEELRYPIKDEANGRNRTIYQKSMGGTKGKTEPRRLHPAGARCRWVSHQLETAKPIAGGREIAPLNSEGNGEALSRYLRRRGLVVDAWEAKQI